jgi:hypothetical protein
LGFDLLNGDGWQSVDCKSLEIRSGEFGDYPNADRGDPSRFYGCRTAFLPALVCFNPFGRCYAAFICDENPLLPRADFLLNVEPQS